MGDQVVSRDAAREAAVRRRRLLAGASAATLLAVSGALPRGARAQDAGALAKVRERGRLVVAVYHDMPPFHAGGQGIDVELARALAEALGVQLALLPFNADENMNDDLRNMVWRGTLLGQAPADVMLHVPVDRPLMEGNPRVRIFGPYWRERVAIARDVRKVPQMESLAVFAGQRIAVPGQSLAGWLLIGADGGAYRGQLDTKWKDGSEAARALQRGDVAAAAGLWSELQSVLGRDARFVVEPLPSPRAPRDGWAVGMAVKRDATDLAQALQAALDGLAGSGALGRMFDAAGLAWRAP